MNRTIDQAGLRRIARLELARHAPLTHKEALKHLQSTMGPYEMDMCAMSDDVAAYLGRHTKH